MARARVKVTVRDRQISAHIGTNPVSDILLVHWVLVGFVLARSRAIQVAGLGVVFHAEGELRNLSNLLFRLVGITEVEITSDIVHIGSRSRVLGVILLFGSARAILASTHVLAKIVVVLGIVSPGSNL